MRREDMKARAKFLARCAHPGCTWKLTAPVTAFTAGRRMDQHEQQHRDQESNE